MDMLNRERLEGYVGVNRGHYRSGRQFNSKLC